MPLDEVQQEIVSGILLQLGGRRFQVMTGAKNFTAIPNGLQFSFPNPGGPNKCRIILTGSDLYRMEFYKVRSGNAVLFGKIWEGVYDDALQSIFTEVTGLQTSLGTLGDLSRTFEKEQR